MGRKGGGRAGFVKASRAAAADDDDQEPAAALPTAEQPAAAAAPKPTTEDATDGPPVISAKAAAFLKDAPPGSDDDGSSDDDGAPRAPGQESKGQVAQRHKREAKALKDTAKRLGKKGKGEVARLEGEMAARHAAELAALSSGRGRSTADAIALAGSLYAATLSGEPKGEGGKKATKAQRRREQRERDDAERDARIAAEVAELGETDRAVEEAGLAEVLAPLGLEVKDIPPDGHCLYRSLEDQLRALPDGGAAAAAAAGLPAAPPAYPALRAAAAAHMRAHADHFRDFVLAMDTADGAVAEGEDVFEAYCAEVEGSAAWGGQVEIQALSAALRAHVQVFAVGMPALEVGEEFEGEGGGPTLRVCYLRHAYGLGEHYNSVVGAAPRGGGGGGEAGEGSGSGSEEEDEA